MKTNILELLNKVKNSDDDLATRFREIQSIHSLMCLSGELYYLMFEWSGINYNKEDEETLVQVTKEALERTKEAIRTMAHLSNKYDVDVFFPEISGNDTELDIISFLENLYFEITNYRENIKRCLGRDVN